jgi:predicted nucleotide-binding protein
MYLVREMYFDDLQPYILNESEFCNLLGKNNDNETEEISIPDIKLENYISDYDVMKEKNKYRIVYSIGAQLDNALEELKDLVTDFKFEIAFSDNSKGDEKNKYVEKLGDKVCFELLNDGKEIIVQ